LVTRHLSLTIILQTKRSRHIILHIIGMTLVAGIHGVPLSANAEEASPPTIITEGANAKYRRTENIQKENPGGDKESNPLPAPDDPIYMVMRLYSPKPEAPSILPPGEGTWLPPGVVIEK
jgi:hypothetical protein